MRYSGVSGALRLLLLAAFVASARAAVPHDRVARVVDAVIRPLMTKDGLPGVAVGVAVDGRSRVFDYGEASLRTHRPVTPDTLFEIGSISKTFTATLASYAAQRDAIVLTHRTEEYFPSLRGSRFGVDVTLLNLATHTPGGLPLQVPASIRTNGELMRYLRAWRPKYPPGTYRTYNNIGIGLVGVATARSMHRAFCILMQRDLLAPLGLRHTFLRVPAAELANYAEGYTSGGRAVRMAPGPLAAQAYGIRSTAGDVLRFLEANMGWGRMSGALRRAILATHTAYFKAGPLTQDLIWEQYLYPVGLRTLLDGNSRTMLFDAVPAAELDPPRRPRGDVWIDKTGETRGFAAYVAFIPEKKLGIVILANRDFPIADEVTAAYDILTRIGRAGELRSDTPPEGRARADHPG